MLQSQTNGSKGWQVILAGCGVGIAAGYQLCKIMNKRNSFKNEGFSNAMIDGNNKSKNEDNLDKEQNIEEYERIVSEQLVRNIQFFGEEGQEKVNKSYVMIFGVGGVGSHVASSLARSGIRRLKIVDSGKISLSSLNYHAFATREDVGRIKVDCVKDYIHRIVPRTVVESVHQRVNADNIMKFFEAEHQPSYVIDCMDDIDAKVALLAHCQQNKIKVVSSMGAELKADPTMLQIRDISEITYDDLSRAVRNRLKSHGVTHSIKFAVNVQKIEPEKVIALKKQQEENAEKFKISGNSRLSKTPVLGTMPALIAYSISSYVLCDLAEQKFEPFPIEDVRQASYVQLFKDLVKQGTKVGLFSFEELKFDKEDIYVIVKQIYGWKDLLNDKKVCGGVIVRWNPELGFNPENLTLLSSQDAKKHWTFKEYKEVVSYYKEEIIQKVARKQAEYEEYKNNNPILYK